MGKQEFCALCFGLGKMIRHATRDWKKGILSRKEYDAVLSKINECPVRFNEVGK